MQEETIQASRVAPAQRAVAMPMLETATARFAHRQCWPPHRHSQAQLIYSIQGVLEVVTTDGTWYVPPQQAIWIPPEIEHGAHACGEVKVQVVMLALPRALAAAHQGTRMLRVSPLLRELLRCLARDGAPYAGTELSEHVRALLLAELSYLDATTLHLPVLEDRRLRTIQTALHENPADDTALATWAQHLHLSTRSLARLFLKETGTSFSHWRQNTRLMLALPRLAAGEAVTRVALDLGYTSPSAFTRMFRRVLGRSPSEFLETSIN